MKDILAIGCYCIGTDHVAHDLAAYEGIAVFNAPYENGRSVAELVMGQTINLLRNLPLHNQRLHGGEWVKTANGSHELRDKTIGIVGYGNIGKQVGVLADAFGMRVLYHDITDQLRLGNAEPTDLETLLQEADVITLHTPGGQLRPVIGMDELLQMKPGSYLINAARGDAVDYPALRKVLESGHLAGAAIDVYPDEPRGKGQLFTSPLVDAPTAILTPHIGGSTVEAQSAIARTVTTKLVRYCREGATLSAINLPEVAMPYQPQTTRLTHIHQNQPGAAAEITDLIAEHGNITASVLGTKGDIGYAMYDIEQLVAKSDLLVAARGLTNCIRSRIIT
jgi:D-3-phosphoglycerate dehydrogenase